MRSWGNASASGGVGKSGGGVKTGWRAHAGGEVWFRRILVVAERPGEGPFAMRFADLRHGGLGGAGSALASRLRAGWMEARVTPSSRAMDELLPWRV